MTEDCRNDCIECLLFPKRLDATLNRPGLSRIDYRIGTYADIREALLRHLNLDPVLAPWTHREADDPGIALLEGAAILGDILTFYQDLYANEAYLRTAQWRESVADLVRLVGYRLSPGLGGKATFAFAVKGEKPVIVPKGFPIKAQLEGTAQPVDFETCADVELIPSLNQFYLYSPFKQPKIGSGTQTFSIATADLSTKVLTLAKGDRLMLVVNPEDSVNTYRQSVIVSNVRQILDQTEITIEGCWKEENPGTDLVVAYKLGRSFRHFGYNAPPKKIVIDGENSEEVAVPFSTQAGYPFPGLQKNKKASNPSPEPGLTWVGGGIVQPDRTFFPLHAEAKDLAIGSTLLVDLKLSNEKSVEFPDDSFVSCFFVREIISITPASWTWGAITAGTTVVELNQVAASDKYIYTDIRTVEFHEVIGAEFELKAAYEAKTYSTLSNLYYYGNAESYQKLNQRSLRFVRGNQMELNSVVIDSKEFDADNSIKLRPLALCSSFQDFTTGDFPLENPTVTVYGNLVEATQGKTEKEAVLGNGDNRQTFQTFKLPKAPLTYRLSKDETPPEVPELDVYVSDRRWTRVSSFFDRGPKEEIYIIREDGNGDSWVQFGDGQTGARLSSGVKNVVAKYRTGIGAYGPLQDGTTPQAEGKLDRLQKIYLPGVASGGSQPETGENAKAAAPGKVQSLGRLVSLQDFETEALGIAGVSKVVARWDLVNNLPTVVLTVLMESGREAEGEALREIVSQYNRDRGPNRFLIHVQFGQRRYVYLSVSGGRAPTVGEDLVQKAVKAALGVTGEEGNGMNGSQGLFSIAQRQFGQPEYATRIEGILQNIEGVVWVRVTQFGVLEAGEDPLTLIYPPIPRDDPSVFCPPDQVLSLHSQHFKPAFTAVDATEVPDHG